jgi:hypothetical protein
MARRILSAIGAPVSSRSAFSIVHCSTSMLTFTRCFGDISRGPMTSNLPRARLYTTRSQYTSLSSNGCRRAGHVTARNMATQQRKPAGDSFRVARRVCRSHGRYLRKHPIVGRAPPGMLIPTTTGGLHHRFQTVRSDASVEAECRNRASIERCPIEPICRRHLRPWLILGILDGRRLTEKTDSAGGTA